MSDIRDVPDTIELINGLKVEIEILKQALRESLVRDWGNVDYGFGITLDEWKNSGSVAGIARLCDFDLENFDPDPEENSASR